MNDETRTIGIDLDEEREMELLRGPIERNIKAIEEHIGARLSTRGARVMIQGTEEEIERAERLIRELRDLHAGGRQIRDQELRFALKAIAEDKAESLSGFLARTIAVSPKKRAVVPRTPMQVAYVDAIRTHDIVFGIGPAGTGKTFLAMAMAVSALLAREVNRIVLARPAVEAGERLGFLPGDLQEKVNPYLRPLYDALFTMMDVQDANRLIEQGTIEIAPLAFMRGRTLDDSFIILDEAQNTTSEQMKMYLTRLGFNSKTVITGDITQIDLPSGKPSGLIEAEKILLAIEGIKVIYFTERDVVRHKLVQAIVKAYEKHERKKSESPPRG